MFYFRSSTIELSTDVIGTTKTSLIPTRIIEVAVPNQESEWSSVLWVSMLPLILGFFYYILELLRQGGIFCFSEISYGMTLYIETRSKAIFQKSLFSLDKIL